MREKSRATLKAAEFVAAVAAATVVQPTFHAYAQANVASEANPKQAPAAPEPTQGARGDAAAARAATHAEPLPKGVRSAPIEVAEERVLFPTRAFESVQVGDTFYVLTPRRNGLMAKVTVVEMGTTGQAICQLNEGGRRWLLDTGQGAPTGLRVIREEDARTHPDAFGKGPLFPSSERAASDLYAPPEAGSAGNALILAGLSASHVLLDAVDALTWRRAAPRALSTSVFGEFFAPHWSPSIYGLNLVGVRISSESASATGVPLTVGSRVRQGNADVTRLRVSPGIRAWFDGRWLSRVGIWYDVVADEKTMFVGEGNVKGEAISKQPGLRIELEAQPVHGFLVGLVASRTLGAASKVSKFDGSGSEVGSAKETLTEVEAAVGARLFLGARPWAPSLETRAGLRYMVRETMPDGGLAPGIDRTQWAGLLTFAAGWVP
jgi:hypothetical protein